MTHLTDEQLQANLDGNNRNQHDEMENHLAQCSFCRTQLAAYRQVYRAARIAPGFAFSASLADAVIDNITFRQNKFASIKQQIFHILTGVLTFGAMLFLLVKYKVGLMLFRLLIHNFHYFSHHIQLLGEKSDSSLLIFVTFILILVISKLMDRMLSDSAHLHEHS